METVLSTSGPLSLNRHRHKLVGASCLWIGMPGLWYYSQGLGFGRLGPVMALVSFFSDYTCASPRDFGPGARRAAFALDLAAIYGYLSLIVVNLVRLAAWADTAAVVAGMVLGQFVVLEWSGRSPDPAAWALRHTGWHAYVTWLGFVAHWAMYREDTALTHPASPVWPGPPPPGLAAAALLLVLSAVAINAMADSLLSLPAAASGVGSDPLRSTRVASSFDKALYPGRTLISRATGWNGK